MGLVQSEEFAASYAGTLAITPPAPGATPGTSLPADPVLRAYLQDLHSIAESLARIADHVAPQPADIVGTPYIAQRLGCTTVWVTEMVKSGQLPNHCIVQGTGNGRPWKFHRRHIDAWLAAR